VLLKKGLRNVWLRGSRPLRPGQPRIVGPAFTLRFVPWREDLATPESWASPSSTRAAIECMPAGCVAVVDAMGVTDAGIFGDILCERIRVREVAGLITDGVIRDLAGVVGWQMPIACGGVAVFPDDIIVADDDGAVVIPAALLDEVVEAAVEQEKLEAWIIEQVRSGLPLPGLYPPNTETKARYAAFRAAQTKAE
jgi:regulator of RNase E activity RraA